MADESLRRPDAGVCEKDKCYRLRFPIRPSKEDFCWLVVVTLACGTLFYWNVEGWGLLDSLYFSVITLTTVGYGDLAPTTADGKVFTMLYIFAGIGIILGFVNTVAERSLRRRRENRDRP